uniref:Reverse transcriptase zinc-binding domain-containing protein n=1 Tax=Oryza barthii TaxID=65489 RepID=A0A0D3HWB1_9ORYZ
MQIIPLQPRISRVTMLRLLADWWIATRWRFQNTYRTDFDSLFMLICWLIWKERNTRIFQHIAKSVDWLADDINEEIAIWRAAGIFSQASELALVCWFVWKERTARIFKHKLRSAEQIFNVIHEEILIWREACIFKQID